MTSRADELDTQAAELAHRAAALRDVAERVNLGNEGELAVGATLEQLHGSGWQVLHDRRKSARSPANLDHVVIGPPGVVVVDAKNWTGGLLRMDDRGIKLGGWRKDDALHAAKVDAELVQGLARQVVPAVHVVGALAFVQDVGLTGPRLHQGVILAQHGQLVSWLKELPQLLSATQVDDLAECLDRELRHRRGPVPAAPTGRPAGRAAGRRSPEAPKTISRGTASARQRRKQERARQQLKGGMVRIAVLLIAAVTLPVTFPILQQYVLTPAAEVLTDRLVDSVQPPTPAPPPAGP